MTVSHGTMMCRYKNRSIHDITLYVCCMSAYVEVLCDHPAVAECAIVAVPDALKGQLPVGLVVLKAGMNITQKKLQEEIILSVRKRVGAIASLKTVIIVKRLPKTRSGKILRAVMRAMAEGKDVPTPPTIEDESVLPEIKTVFKEAGIVQ